LNGLQHEQASQTRQAALALPILTGVLVAGLLVSGWQPHDRATWWMEVFPVLVVLPLLWATRRQFALTPLVYGLIAVHGLILMVGGAYTYARVPFGYTLQELLQLDRNPYDRIGHFAQGFVPALAIREILLRGRYVTARRMLAFLVICVVLAVSASYEFIEWGAALALGQGADEFLGTQGDPWDTQWDMFMALLGSIAALLTLTRWHDAQLAGLAQPLHPRRDQG
jgi:putative membrane protein